MFSSSIISDGSWFIHTTPESLKLGQIVAPDEGNCTHKLGLANIDNELGKFKSSGRIPGDSAIYQRGGLCAYPAPN
jgi:hypothetical protein